VDEFFTAENIIIFCLCVWIIFAVIGLCLWQEFFDHVDTKSIKKESRTYGEYWWRVFEERWDRFEKIAMWPFTILWMVIKLLKEKYSMIDKEIIDD
jgi:hypothetical protein